MGKIQTPIIDVHMSTSRNNTFNTWAKSPGVLCGCTVFVHDKKYFGITAGKLLFENGTSVNVKYTVKNACRLPSVHGRYMYIVAMAAPHDLIIRCFDIPEGHMYPPEESVTPVRVTYSKDTPEAGPRITEMLPVPRDTVRRTSPNDSNITGGGPAFMHTGIVLARIVVPDEIKTSDDIRVYNVRPEGDNSTVISFNVMPPADGKRAHFYLPDYVYSPKSVRLTVNGVDQVEGEDYTLGLETMPDGSMAPVIDFMSEVPARGSDMIATIYKGKVAADEV